MVYQSATEVRANFSEVMDKAVYDRPQFIRRTRNHAVLMGCEMIIELLRDVMLHCEIEKEDDASFVMTCNEIEHLIATGGSPQAAKSDMAEQFLEYANDYYSEYGFYVRGTNTKEHLPYVMKAMMLGSAKSVEDMIICPDGKN